MSNYSLRKDGFTLVEIMIVVAIIGLLASIAIPNFVRARAKSQINTCIANLKQIDGAKEMYALDYRLKTGDACGLTRLSPNYLKAKPSCPSGSAAYKVNNIGTDPECSNYNESNNDLNYHKLGATL